MTNEYDRKNEKDEKSLGQHGPQPERPKEPGRDTNDSSEGEFRRSGSNPGSRSKTSTQESDNQ